MTKIDAARALAAVAAATAAMAAAVQAPDAATISAAVLAMAVVVVGVLKLVAPKAKVTVEAETLETDVAPLLGTLAARK